MQSALKSLKTDCNDDVKCRVQTSKEQAAIHRTDMPLLWLVVLMLFTTLIYLGWSVNKIHNMHHSINSIHKEKNEANRKADLFFEAVRKQKEK